jgi:hypothetical protein
MGPAAEGGMGPAAEGGMGPAAGGEVDAAPGGGVDAGPAAGSSARRVARPAARSATRSATRYTRSAPIPVGLRVTAVDARAPGPGIHGPSLACVVSDQSSLPLSPGASGASGALPLLTDNNTVSPGSA